MPVLTNSPGDAAAVATGFATPGRLVVVAMCAAWCDTCRDFRDAFDRIAGARAGATFVWLDIEDDSDVCGDVDVENFPTLAIYRGDTPVHFGVSLPHEGTVARLVDALAEGSAPLVEPPQAVSALPGAFPGGKPPRDR
jgi:thioredoxin reductase (NADPH)